MRIQELIGNAFRQTGSLVALTDGGQMNPNKLQKTLEQTMEQFEAATLELRKLCERYAPGSGGFAKKPILPSMDVTGSVEAFGYLPPCTQYLTKKGAVVDAPLIQVDRKDRGSPRK